MFAAALPRRSACLLSIVVLAAAATPARADPVTWISPDSGLWTASSNWSSDPALPDLLSDVIIDQPAPLTVTLSSGSQSIHSLLVNDTLLLSGGALSVGTTAQVAGQLTLAGGTLQNATLSTLASGIITLTSGSLSNVTVASNLSATNAALALTNNLTLSNSTLTFSGTTASTLSFAGNETVGGTGTIIFNGTRSTSLLGTTAALTIAPGVTLATGSASVSVQVGTLINQGTLAAQISGKSISINSPTFTNSGSLKAVNGGTVTINSSAWTTPGSITLDGTSTLNLGGSFVPSALAAIARTGGTINITGILDNANNTLALGSSSGAYSVLGGTIKNGNISLAGGGAINLLTAGTVSVNGLSVGVGGQLTQTAGTLSLTSLTESGGAISLGGPQSRYALPTVNLTGGTTTLTSDAAKTLITSALTFGGAAGNWTGQLDLGANKLIVQTTADTKAAALSALQSQVLYGTAHAAGITSASLPANMGIAVVDNAALRTPFSTFGGENVTGSSLLVARELLGDSDLSGSVDLNDLNAVLNHLGNIDSNWSDGNFDGSSTIDLNDLNAVLNNLGVSYANNAGVVAAEALVPGVVPTPEPASLVLLVGGLLFCGCRRKPLPA